MNKSVLIGLVMLLLVSTLAIATCPADHTCTPKILKYTVNPCIYNMELNTEVDVSIYAWACSGITDFNNWVGNNGCGSNINCRKMHYKQYCDNTSARVTLYYGDTNEQDTGWSDFEIPVATPDYYVDTPFYWDSSNFHLNKSGTYTMKLWLKSTNDSEVTNTFLVNYTVIPTNGSLYGECQTNGTSNIPTSSISQTDNPYANAFNGFGNTWTSNLIYMLFMCVIGGALLFTLGTGRASGYKVNLEFIEEVGRSSGWVFGLLFVVEGLLALLGVWIEALSPIWLIVLAFGIIIPITLKVSGWINNNR